MPNKKVIVATAVCVAIFVVVMFAYIFSSSKITDTPKKEAAIPQKSDVQKKNSDQVSVSANKEKNEKDIVPIESGDEDEYLGEDEADDLEKSYDASDKDLVF